MNKQIRKEIGIIKYKKRLENNGITDLVRQKIIDRGAVANFYCYKTTGKPCSCSNCSPAKVEEKAKYRFNKFNKKDIYEEIYFFNHNRISI
jgi:hypothetical protein